MSNRKDLLKNKARMWIYDELAAVKAWREVGFIDSAEFSMITNQGDIKSPSGTNIYSFSDPDAEVGADWYHPGDYSKIELMFRGIVSLQTTNGSTDITETVLVEFQNAGDAYPLPGYDGDKSAVTISAVVLDSAPSTAYTVTTDYTVSADATTGMSQIVQVSGGSIPLATPIRVTYTYRPLAARIVKPVDNGVLIPRHVLLRIHASYRRYEVPPPVLATLHDHERYAPASP